MRFFLALAFILLSISGYCQTEFENIDREIKSLLSKDKIDSYWLKIYESDQNNNGAGTMPHDENTDILNLYKVAVLINVYGYPDKNNFTYPVTEVPWLVWTHCNNPEIKTYTIPIILRGKELKQLPGNMYPNYFVGGLLVSYYGLDMEFDPDFKNSKSSIMALATEQFENIKNNVKIKKLRKIIQQQKNVCNYSIIRTLGVWSILQHNNTIKYELSLLSDNNWYLKITDNNSKTVRKIKRNKSLNTFKSTGIFSFFSFTVSSNNEKLLFHNKQGIVKTIYRKL